ncbi:MAG: serine/threonine protein kinase [Sanguibacteroides justesenii]|mgnify:FL=1|uniref:protein kinase domain-containing protein n=1 Tax=Butyricimonas faecalis TaxID=2093856 RepID=UPI001DDB18A5|nr:serine/threonine protein kinase [Sanguibacteroides justesenii]
MNEETLSSGFFGEDITVDIYSDLKEFYTPANGYSRLHLCRRYGKLHILKSLQPFYSSQEFYKQLLLKEFNIGYQLDHPNIRHTIGWEKNDLLGNYIVLEYIDGIPLTTFIEQGKLTRALAYKFITETCNALQYIHNKQLIHKDLKPNNILITYNGNNVKLIDFGLADCDDYEILKIPAGTEKYLAPEQLDPNATLDCRTDIYSLGIIIEELATILKDRKLASIAQKCTCQNPNSRFNNTAEIVETLKSKSFGTIYKYAAFIIVSFLIAFLYLQPPFAGNKSPNRNTITQVYSNFSTGNAYHHTLLQEKSRLHRNITRYSANRQDLVQDSLLMYQALRKALNTDYPESDQRETPVYKKLLTNMQLDVKREIKNIREKL